MPIAFLNTQRARSIRRVAFWSVVIASVGMLFLTPLTDVSERARAVAPWVGASLVLSELLFVVGLLVIALAAGVRLPRNPLAWRAELPSLLASLHRTPAFWVGLIVNTIGALGTAVVLIVAITRGLPWQSWGLLVLPVTDLMLTLAVRAGVTNSVRHAAAATEAVR